MAYSISHICMSQLKVPQYWRTWKILYQQCKIFIVWYTRLVVLYKKWQGYVGTHSKFCYRDYFTSYHIWGEAGPPVNPWRRSRPTYQSLFLMIFPFECCEVHVTNIANDENHQFCSRIVFNNLKISYREKNISSRFRPAIARTQKIGRASCRERV